jgi:hypothetical protein
VDLRRPRSAATAGNREASTGRGAPSSRGALSASPLRGMLELSAAMRAVGAEPTLRSAVAALEREALRLTTAREATVLVVDRVRNALWTCAGSAISDEVSGLVVHVADTGHRELSGHALYEPIGAPPARAVLALRRTARDRFDPDAVALIAALAGGVAATLHRLIDAASRAQPGEPGELAPRLGEASNRAPRRP